MSSARNRALAAGLAVAAIYLGGAALSGHLSPLARRPLLDGIAPPTPYRWVEPPPELIETNLPPTPGTFTARLGETGSGYEVFTTDDAQVTLLLPEGAFAAARDQRAVEVSIEPLGPSGFGEPEAPLAINGNVYLLEATYEPSGNEAQLQADATVVLVYPSLSNIHGDRSIVASRDGAEWRSLDSIDLPGIQQTDAEVGRLGYVAVAALPGAPTSAPGIDGNSRASTIIVVGMIVVLVAAAVFMIQPWAMSRSRNRSQLPPVGRSVEESTHSVRSGTSRPTRRRRSRSRKRKARRRRKG